MFYSMHVLTIIITCTFLAELEVQEKKIGSYMRTRVIKDTHGYQSHEEEFRGLHISMGNVEIESNGRRIRNEPIIMRSPHREVQIYREDNEKIMKAQEEILEILNILQRQANKDSGIKQATNVRQVT